ncbi:spaetzle-processing enzyme isoform X1 [Drosophila elegans]|uniref:spaetzle-processing enzyme isoform X1 n=1 Tax=Drosophila elegans TaxID=30023 RepID=UPI0007E8A5EF|nr:spaetzle-processing enzyme isoform X1 [Drosophila elegans]
MASTERNFLLLALVVSAFSGIIQRADAAQISFGTCTPQQSDERGQCVHIASCPYLANLLKVEPKTTAQRQLLSRSQCGLDNRVEGLVNRILVCCPQSKRDVNEETPEVALEEGQQPGNVLPGSDVCGFLFADRIFGGTNTSLWEFPWMVLLQYKKPVFSETYSFNCGGALLNSRYVLTAGHCLSSRELDKSGVALHSVRLGEWDTRTDPDCAVQPNKKRICAPNSIDIEVEKSIIHEQFSPNSVDQKNDIALLRLKRSVSYTDYVRPICLPTDDLVRNNFVDYGMDVAGWGLTENMQPSPVKLKISVNVWNLTTCQSKYTTFKVNLDDTQMCAGGQLGMDTCGGDSGGPLMVGINSGGREVFYIAGITSYGTKPCGLKGWPGVYTRTGPFIDWIRHKLEA